MSKACLFLFLCLVLPSASSIRDFRIQNLLGRSTDAKAHRQKRNSPRGGSAAIVEEVTLHDLPDTIDEASISLLVKEILKDNKTNIRLLPDRIEAGLYRNTVRLTLNAIYQVLKNADGQPFLMGHEVKLRHFPNSQGKTVAFARATTSHVNVKSLEEVADRLLRNENINQPLIPDVLERQIYVNCLKVVFRLLDVLQSSLRVNVCGHSLGLFLSNSTQSTGMPPTASINRATTILSNVSQEELLRYQINAGIHDSRHHSGGLLSFFRRDWLSQLHATMFGLVVQIIQDMLDDSAIEFVGVGKIVMDLIPSNSTAVVPYKETEEGLPHSKRKDHPARIFVSGMGLGATLVVLLVNIVDDNVDGFLDIKSWPRKIKSWIDGRIRRLNRSMKSMVGSVSSLFRRSDNQ